MKDGKHITLAIESSCDETSVALVADGRQVLSNIISSQIDIHKLYGGVVPEIASRHHLENINAVTDRAFEEANQTWIELAYANSKSGEETGKAKGVEAGAAAGVETGAAAGVETGAAARVDTEAVAGVETGAMTAEAHPLTMQDVDLVGVTNGPGLIGALLIGVATAKAYALATHKPIVGVHHIKGHISANYIEAPDLKPPFMALVCSGGHTSIIDVKGYNTFEVLGATRDDAVGEAYDKVARVIGLGYPGGPLIDQIAKKGNPHAAEFKRVMLEEGSLDFSFSGTKTGVLNYVNNERQQGREINVPDIAASFQQAVLETVVTKVLLAAEQKGEDKIVVAGGVAANSKLREMLKTECDKRGMGLYIPSPILCTDNAAMIGCAAYYQYMEKGADDLSLNAFANLDL